MLGVGVAVGFDADGDERPFADEGFCVKGFVDVTGGAGVALHESGVGGFLRLGGGVECVVFDRHRKF